jgi:hypothetical protein
LRTRGGGEEAKATPPPTCAALIETRARVYWERKGLGFKCHNIASDIILIFIEIEI